MEAKRKLQQCEAQPFEFVLMSLKIVYDQVLIKEMKN